MTTKRYTISEISAHNKEKGNYFFSKETLSFFKQTKSMFKVVHCGERVFVYAKAGHTGYTIAEYNKDTGDVSPVSRFKLESLAGGELNSPEVIKKVLKEYVK